MKALAAAFFGLILLSASSSLVQGCLTGADSAPCDDAVNLTEIISYIESWYNCSACVPDLFLALQAYFGIPFCGDKVCSGAAGENASSCPGDCPFCDTIYNCTSYDEADCDAPDPCNVSTLGCRWDHGIGACVALIGCSNDADCTCPADKCDGNDFVDYADDGICQDGICDNGSVFGGCSPVITHNFPACMPGSCGNGTIEANETCDLGDLGGQTCQGQGFGRGNLTCCGDCKGLNLTGCGNETCVSCSDGDGPDYYTASGISADVNISYGPNCAGGAQRVDDSTTDVYDDYCDGNTLVEFTCSGSCGGSVRYDCESESKVCRDGACADIEFTGGCTLITDPSITYLLDADIQYDQNSACIQVRANDVTIDCQGHSINGSGTTEAAGIFSDGEGTVIRDCAITDMRNGGEGVYLQNANRSSIYNCSFTGDYYGVYVSNSTDVNISGNRFVSNVKFGIETQQLSDRTRIEGNVFRNGEHSAWVAHPYAVISGNEIDNFTNALDVWDTADHILISGNRVTNSWNGISPDSTNITIRDNVISSIHNSGIWIGRLAEPLDVVKMVNISNNTIRDCFYGISFDAGKDGVAEFNAIYNATESAIISQSDRGNIIRNNTVSGSFRGIYLLYTNATRISGNNASGNTYGVAATDSDETVIESNRISGNENGIYLVGDSWPGPITNNVICGNTNDVYCSWSSMRFIGNRCGYLPGRYTCGGYCASCP